MTQRTDAKEALRDWYQAKSSWYGSDALRLLRRGPDFIVSDWWHHIGHNGLSPFALAGISDTSPRRVLWRLERWPCTLTLDFCCTTYLPVLMSGYGDNRMLRNYHPEEVVEHLVDEFYDDGWPDKRSRDPEDYSDWSRERILEKHADKLRDLQLPTMLRKYGGPDWRKHCTKDFNPFHKKVVQISDGLWQDLRTLWQLANAAAR